MQGCLTFNNGVLYVGRHERTAHIRPYDLDGAPLGPGFHFGGPSSDRERSTWVGGLDVDAEHQVWIADGACERARAFNLFGTEVGGFGAQAGARQDSAGSLERVVDLCVRVDEEREAEILVACGGRRRHAVQVFAPDGALLHSLRPVGNPEGRFRGVRGLSESGRWTCVAEGWERRVQVFRDRDYHFSFSLDVSGRQPFEPTAVVAVPDGRFVVAQGGERSAVTLVDAGGRALRVLAQSGLDTGSVFEPNDLAVEPNERDRDTRVAVIDRDGERVQVFTLEGVCYGAFESLPGESA